MEMTLMNGKAVQVDSDGYIEVKIHVSLDHLIDNDFDEFLSLISEKATGSECLMDVGYSLSRVVNETTVELIVTGDASMCVDE